MHSASSRVGPELPAGCRTCRSGVGEERLPAEDRAEGAVGDDAGDSRGHDHFGLELGRPVQHLGGEERAGERGAEDGGDARSHARGHEDAPLARSQIAASRPRATRSPAPIWAMGPSRPPEPPGADGERAGDDLHQRHAGPDVAVVLVVGGDDRVGAVALGLGGEGEDEQPAGQAAHRGKQEQQPGPKDARLVKEQGELGSPAGRGSGE